MDDQKEVAELTQREVEDLINVKKEQLTKFSEAITEMERKLVISRNARSQLIGGIQALSQLLPQPEPVEESKIITPSDELIVPEKPDTKE